MMKPYLLSTLGEIALAANDLDLAERYFAEGLALAEQLSMPERLAGLTANLGLVARARGQNDLAIHRLSTARAGACRRVGDPPSRRADSPLARSSAPRRSGPYLPG
jgi:hypothetical protein